MAQDSWQYEKLPGILEARSHFEEVDLNSKCLKVNSAVPKFLHDFPLTDTTDSWWKANTQRTKLIGLIHLHTELLANILGHYIVCQPLLEQYFANSYGEVYPSYQPNSLTSQMAINKTCRLMEIVVKTSAYTLLKPQSPQILLTNMLPWM